MKQGAAEAENENLEAEHAEAENGETSAGSESQEAETKESEKESKESEAKEARKDPKDAQIEELQDRARWLSSITSANVRKKKRQPCMRSEQRTSSRRSFRC